MSRILLALSGLLLANVVPLHGQVVPARLRCEYRIDPLGIGELRPRLGWIVEAGGEERGVQQSAYQLLVASSPELLNGDTGDLWDTGKVASDRTQQIEYAGQALRPREVCWWKVRLWDQHDRATGWSAPAHWSVGLSPEEWGARWIGLDAEPPQGPGVLGLPIREKIARQPWIYADLSISKSFPRTGFFRGRFEIDPARLPVEATLAVVPDQVCDVTVNGRAAGSMTRWQQLAGVNITPFLVAGHNIIGLEITQRDGYPPAALGSLILRFADGRTQIVPIDTSWKFSTNFAADWTLRDFDDRTWKPSLAPVDKRNPWDGPPQTFTAWVPPATMLKKGFHVSKAVRRATLYSTALGAYEMHLNGVRVGRDYLTPGWTDFHARVQYQTYDLTDRIHPGSNVIGALLGDGWYASVLGYTGQRYFYGGYPRLLAQLEIDYADGSRDIIPSDASWLATHDGPIRSADLMQGCVYDARQERRDWASPASNESDWHAVAVGLRPIDPQKPLAKFSIEAANAEPTRIETELKAVRVSEPRPGAYTFDFGQNLVGWARLRIAGHPGQKIMVRHGEMLNPNGTLYTSNLRGANATDTYILRGEGTETLEPFFTFHGFRYIEISGLDSAPDLNSVRGEVVHSDLERTGLFECSDPSINQLFQNVIWGQRGNYIEVPTDCPQRDERAGWSGDAQFFIQTGAYNFNVAPFFSRWLTTLAIDGQLPEGSVANVAPAFGSLWASPGWGGDAVIVCTDVVYRTYGDTRIIERNYDSMARYLAWLGGEKKPGGIRLRQLGDHLNLGGGADLGAIGQAYRAYLNGLMAEMAAAIGRREEAALYSRKHDDAQKTFQREWVLADGAIRNSSQTGYALAFSMNLLTNESKARVAAKFVEEIEKFDWHLATGFIGTPRLLPALHLAGRDDVAHRLLFQETYPSWLFQVKNGATTVWERWDGWTPEKGFQTIAMNSFNHYSFGSVAEYLYKNVAGIETAAPGFKTFMIRPSVGEGLTSARASYDSIVGGIRSEWTLDGEHLAMNVEIPPNTEATVFVPSRQGTPVQEAGQRAESALGVTWVQFDDGCAVFRVGSGHYHFLSVVSPGVQN